ncbi:MAG TPA: class I SAM-dependent methyltransferase [Pyrinomonadaceae bacterium]|jgi:ubiquinone/menaquinone biosynthesis C-methylase UbiE|nr:class I SAM-dependent methyltransferase [Pyrinomonadaceae bacterium]
MLFSYDRLAPHYDSRIAPLERKFLERLRREAIDALPAGGRVLELGAGTGLNFQFYRPHTHGVATEPSTQMLRIAARKGKPLALCLVQSCGEQLPFADGSFDSALATLVMCSVKSPELVFGELRRVVKTGGHISLLEHVRPDGILGLAFDLGNLITVPLFGDHLNRRTVEYAGNAGLKVTSVKRVRWGIINLITCVNGKDEG